MLHKVDLVYFCFTFYTGFNARLGHPETGQLLALWPQQYFCDCAQSCCFDCHNDGLHTVLFLCKPLGKYDMFIHKPCTRYLYYLQIM